MNEASEVVMPAAVKHALNAEDLTLGQILSLVRRVIGRDDDELRFNVNDAVVIRTVTMIQVGRVTHIGREFISMTDGGWIADTGRFSTMLEKGELGEFERAPNWFMVARGSIVDVWPWKHPLPKETK